MKPFDKPLNVTRPYLPDLQEVNQELQDIWQSQWLTNVGMKHKRLEEELKKKLKVPWLSLFNNGTTALLVAVKSLNLSGEVITTPFTFPATTHILAWNNITPVFCDIDAQSLTLDANKLEQLITPRTTGILGVHVYGLPCNVKGIQEIADSHGLRVIYDAAHAFGTEIAGVGIGAFGDVSMFSFHSTKLFHTLEGGALTFNSPELKRQIDLLKNFGIENEETVVLPGINGKMNELQAAIGLINLRHYQEENERREKIFETYRLNLAGIPGLALIEMPAEVKSSYQYLAVRISAEYGLSRDEVYQELKKYNVFARKYFFPLCSDYSCYRQLASADPRKLPVAQKVVNEVICLPLYGALQLHEVEEVCSLLRELKR